MRQRPSGDLRVRADEGHGPSDPVPLDAVLKLWADEGGGREFEVTGRSMHPILDGIQRVRVRMGSAGVRFGDIVLFYHGGKLIAHRVVGGLRGQYLTRGDGSRGFDPRRLSRRAILGVVTHLLWDDHQVRLDGPGTALVRATLGFISRAAGTLRISAPGSVPARTLPGRLRDATLGPLYRGGIRWLFGAYARVARLSARLEHARSFRSSRMLIRILRPSPVSLHPRPGDARKILRKATRLGVGGILAERLDQPECEVELPPDAVADLRRTSYAQALYNTVMLRELGEILSALEKEGIHPVVLKGASLAGRLYEGIGLRSLSDLDLLLAEEEIPSADGVLRARGYRQHVDPRFTDLYENHHHKAPYVPPRGHPRVELHTGILAPAQGFRPDVERFRRRAVGATFDRAAARIPTPEDQLLHACLHMAVSDRFVRGLKDLLDIDRLVRHSGDLDWETFLEAVVTDGLGRPVYYALGLAAQLLETPVPAPALARLRSHRLPFLEDRILRTTAAHYLTASGETEAVFGVATAKELAGVFLSEPSARRRWSWMAWRLVGRRGGAAPEAA